MADSSSMHDAADDTMSFSVADALRAPVGAQLASENTARVRSAARLLLLGLVLILLDVRPSDGLDVVPDVAGGVAIILGALAVGQLSKAVGPVRAGSRAVVLAVVHLFLLVPNDVPAETLGITQLTADLLAVAQTVVALLGTAVVATVLARAHDALGQLGRRDRWGATRRWGLLLAVLWIPFATASAYTGPDASSLLGLFVGAGSVLMVGVGLAVLFLLGRALAASINVHLRVGFGEG